MDRMSAAIMMTDAWQPTVLQLMPFSTNNASNTAVAYDDRTRGYSQTRGFPTLAVTRSRDQKDGGKPTRVSSERMPRPHPVTGKATVKPRAKSEYRLKSTEVVRETSVSVNNINGKIINKTSEFRDSPDSSDSFSTSESPKNIKLLPKPSPSKPVDGRYFLPQNGFWRSVTLTPGEIDLQKHRDTYVKEQSKPNKKYKLNVNQLPRSTTPINDNDPDKLNMKQVIRFLQTKPEQDTADKHAPSPRKFDRRVKSGYPSTAPSRMAIKTSQDREPPPDVSFPPMIQMRREVTSVLPMTNQGPPRSSPVLKKRGHRSRVSTDQQKLSADSNRTSFSNTREFRLHRFLTMAPNADELAHVVNRQTFPLSSTHKRLLITECSKTADIETDSMRMSYSPVPSYSPSRQGERYAKLQYRLPTKRADTHSQQPESAPQTGAASRQSDTLGVGIIRLPSMLDFHTDSDNEDNKEDAKWKKSIAELKDMFASSESIATRTNGSHPESVPDNKDVLSDSDSSSKPPSRKVTVSLPRESRDDKCADLSRQGVPDMVRLSMRQGRDLTREKTYMSDIARQRSDSDLQESLSPSLPSVMASKDSKDDEGNVSRNS